MFCRCVFVFVCNGYHKLWWFLCEHHDGQRKLWWMWHGMHGWYNLCGWRMCMSRGTDSVCGCLYRNCYRLEQLWHVWSHMQHGTVVFGRCVCDCVPHGNNLV
jgi:hypothetical protein